MNLTIIILISIITLLFIFRGTEHIDKLLNKYVDIKNIVTTTPKRFGDIVLNSESFTVKFMWTTKQISFTHINKVRAYSTVDMGLENHFDFLEIHTKEKEVLSFDTSQNYHRDIVSNFIKTHLNKTINLNADFPPMGADTNGDILCGTNNG
jgi:hypothetical protein